MPKLTISDLNKIYSDADLADAELFAEQRSNVRLVNGEHYSRKSKFHWQRFRESSNFSNDQKVRITQNHIHGISKSYCNSILGLAQDAAVLPNNESEMQDQKAAELNMSVWEDGKKNNDWVNRKAQLVSDFVDLGEACVKIFYNPNVGEIVDYEPEVGQDGSPLIDEMGQAVKSETPIRSGRLEIKRVLSFNLLREPAAKSKEEARYVVVRYMADVNEVKSWVKEDKDKLEFVRQSADETYKVFNGTTGEYEDSKDQVMIREYYYKPDNEYPNGYYFITTPYGILFEGELPFGIFPIVWEGFDDIQTSCRSRSIIKQLRSYQAEINRAVSTMVEIQLSNGFDKVFVQNGTKISPQQYLPGVRAYNFQGQPPVVIEGRTGDQFLNYLNTQIDQMYKVAKLEDLPVDKVAGLDPYAMLFLDARQKKVFSAYATKFGSFLIKICERYLELAKNYYTPEMLIPIIGKKEAVNISEFSNTLPFSYTVKVVEGSEDVGSVIGKQLQINQLLQYAGGNLSREDIGKLAKNMPYLNKEKLFDDYTIDSDSADNAVLALDRGEIPIVSKSDNHTYMIKRLTARQRQSDFQFLDPMIQENYERYKQIHEQFEVQIQQEIQAAQQGFIPAGGFLVTVDFYVEKDGKQQRVRLPQKSVEWLIEKLNQQGAYYEQISNMNPADQASMANMLTSNQNSQANQAQGMSDIMGSLSQEAMMQPENMGV